MPSLNVKLGQAEALTKGNKLIVSSGVAQREWVWTGKGLATVGLKDLRTGHEWVSNSETPLSSDWNQPGLIGDQPARLVSLTAAPSTDSQFTSKMLQVVAEVNYPESGLTVRYVIWAYPGGPGLRMQLWVKGKSLSHDPASDKNIAQVDYLPVVFSPAQAVGYYNSTQHRDMAKDHLIRDESVPLGMVNWANLVATENQYGGIALVKESHKCVNQQGVDTGTFVLSNHGTAVTGWGLSLKDLSPDKFQWCWATWMILYPKPGVDARELAVKEFDRLRYPPDEKLDMVLQVNPFGTGLSKDQSRSTAAEKEILPELNSAADLGLDSLLVNAGWSTGLMPGKKSKGNDEWHPRPDWYPNGWSNVVSVAERLHIELGLWMAASVPLKDMEWNYDRGHFAIWKQDFAHLNTYAEAAYCLNKSREFIAFTGHKVRLNWDVTENAPRFGYFWARECGTVWLENRKTGWPANAVAKPWLILRDSWELARYMNNNQFFLPVQNFRLVDPKLSDAHLYSQTYAVALGLTGLPLFFQNIRLLNADERAEIRPLISIYKTQRAEMFKDYEFPVGAEPSNGSWSGFQWVDDQAKSGYLMIFRERENQETVHNFQLRFLQPGATVELQDLVSGNKKSVKLDGNTSVSLTIAKPGGILFLKYQVE